MSKTIKQDIAELAALSEAISDQMPPTGDPQFPQWVTARALASIAASLASINLYGLETTAKE